MSRERGRKRSSALSSSTPGNPDRQDAPTREQGLQFKTMALHLATVTAILLASVLSAEARQTVRLEFSEGRVNLAAQDAPIRAILAEWARRGGVTVVNGDGLVGPPVTLELAAVPERQALDILLRGVAGYMIAPRRAGSTGVSVFDRILILPTSASPATPPSPANGPRPAPQWPPILGRPPQPESPPSQPDDAAAEQPEAREGGSNQPLRPADQRLRPPIVQNPDTTTVDADDQQPPDDDVPAARTTPGNPFGIPAGSSATPGVVTPAPQGQRPGPARVQ